MNNEHQHPFQPFTLKAESLEQAEELIAKVKEQFPSHMVEALRLKARVVEAGIEVTMEGPGVWAQVVLDPTADPAISYHILEHVPDAVHESIRQMVEGSGGNQSTDSETPHEGG